MTTYQELRHEADTRWESRQVEKPWIRVGTAMCGNAAGAQQVISSLKSSLDSMNLDVNLDEVGCLGLCYAEPLIDIQLPGSSRLFFDNVVPDKVNDLLQSYISDGKVPLERCRASTFSD